MLVKLFQLTVVSVQILYLILQHGTRFDYRFLNNTTYTTETLVVSQHLHLVYAIDHLRRLLNLLIHNLDSGVVSAIRVLLKFYAVIN